MRVIQYSTPHGITVTRTKSKANYRKGLRHLLRELDTHRGFYLSSGYEFPGRYSRWDFASTKPPLEILAFDRRVEFRPLNVRGEILAQMFFAVLREHPHWESFGLGPGGVLAGTLKPLPKLFPEEERSKQPSVFSILRALIQESSFSPGFEVSVPVSCLSLFPVSTLNPKLPRADAWPRQSEC